MRYVWPRPYSQDNGKVIFEIIHREETKLFRIGGVPHQKSCSRKVRNTAVGSRNILELMTKVQSKIVRLTAGPVKKPSKIMQKKF